MGLSREALEKAGVGGRGWLSREAEENGGNEKTLCKVCFFS